MDNIKEEDVPPDQVTQFADRLVLGNSKVSSIMTYPHPFTNGGMVVVFDDTASPYSHLHATVINADPPKDEMHIVKRSDLFLLSVPSFNPLAPLDYPHMVYYLKNRGQLIHGEDLRTYIHAPSCMDSMLIYLLDITACWFRDHIILHDLQTNAFTSLVDAIDTRLRFLMSIALLCQTGRWEVQTSSVPADFLELLADGDLRETWYEFEEIRASASSQDINLETAIRVVWLFEVFTRGLRRYGE
jgi:hypothetical protein